MMKAMKMTEPIAQCTAHGLSTMSNKEELRYRVASSPRAIKYFSHIDRFEIMKLKCVMYLRFYLNTFAWSNKNLKCKWMNGKWAYNDTARPQGIVEVRCVDTNTQYKSITDDNNSFQRFIQHIEVIRYDLMLQT